MPMPVSTTVISSCEPTRSSSTWTLPPRGVNLIEFDSRLVMTCCRRPGSPGIGPTEGSSRRSMRTPLPSAAGRTVSSAASMNWIGSTGWISSRTLPDAMRFMSSRSSMSCTCARELRSIVSSPFCTSSGFLTPRRRIWIQPMIALSGVRSSCDRVARKSSLSALIRSARSRAERSLSSRRSRSSAPRWAASYRRALSIATAAWVAIPVMMFRLRWVKTPGSGCPKNRPPITSPERATTGTAR